MPISLINQMRREAIELLDEARIPVKDRAYKDSKIKYSPKKYAKDTNSNSKIRVKINNISIFCYLQQPLPSLVLK